MLIRPMKMMNNKYTRCIQLRKNAIKIVETEEENNRASERTMLRYNDSILTAICGRNDALKRKKIKNMKRSETQVKTSRKFEAILLNFLGVNEHTLE